MMGMGEDSLETGTSRGKKYEEKKLKICQHVSYIAVVTHPAKPEVLFFCLDERIGQSYPSILQI